MSSGADPAVAGEQGSRPEALATAVAGVWARFRGAVLARVDAVEGAALALLEGALDEDRRRAAEREAHKLAGSVGTFGFAVASRLAREAEGLLEGSTPLAEAEALRLADLAVALRSELSGDPAPAAPAPRIPAPPAMVAADDPAAGEPAGDRDVSGSGGGAGPLLLIVEADPESAERVVMEAQGRGFRTRVATTLGAARAALAEERPDAALVELELGFASSGGLTVLGELSRVEPPVPAVVLTARSEFADRLEVARLGGRGFLRKPVPPARSVDAVEPLLRRAEGRAGVVLAVDDDPAVLAAVRQVLGRGNVRVEALSDPREFWEALEHLTPDAVLLDVDMPHANGVELCRVVRNDPRWGTLPIVVLTGRVDPETIERVFAAGADDYVAKPFVGPELLARVANRLERVGLQRRLAETDPLTGVANRRGSGEVMDRFLALASRRGEPFSVAVVDLDRFKAINDRYGHTAGDEVLSRVARLLQRSFRTEDVVARWGGEEFVVGMFGMAKEDGVRRLGQILERLRDERFGKGEAAFGVTFSAGVAEYPGDGDDLRALYRAADGAMYLAKESGRDRVLPVGWSPEQSGEPRVVDVLVVEDDPALARLLEQALQTRGYRSEWVEEGTRAVELLGGPHPQLRARVVLLDVDLPGLDGHGVLRALGRERVLERTRVIMLTVRTHEAEVLRALEEGAFDHVAKPFSVPVLLQRIRRALR